MKLSHKILIICLILFSAIGCIVKVSNSCNAYANNKPMPKPIKSEDILYSKCSIVSVLPTPDELNKNKNKIIYDDSMIPNDNLPNFVEPNRPEEIDIWSIPVDIDENDVRLIANVIYGEARGIVSKRDKAAVVWCILNRVDSTIYDFKKVNTIYEVITQPSQFDGYNYNNPTTEEFMDLARDVIHRWKLEKMGYEDVGRVLPKDYCWFLGDYYFNYFTNIWCKGNIEKAKANAYNWALGSPYEEE